LTSFRLWKGSYDYEPEKPLRIGTNILTREENNIETFIGELVDRLKRKSPSGNDDFSDRNPHRFSMQMREDMGLRRQEGRSG